MATPSNGQLVPRLYQTEILIKAMQSNVLAALATGSGKTLIATLLVRWIASQPTQASKKIFFLVPKVPLVKQQQDFLASQTSQLNIKGFIGAMNVDLWDRTRWMAEIKENDVLVMTPAILLRLLAHATISISDISLIVFDEAHHGRGNHPYAQIMRDHYDHCEESLRPKIFGMTASPLWSPKNPEKDIRSIQATLHCTIISVQANRDELGVHSPQAEAEVIIYDPPSPWVDPESLWNEISSLDMLPAFVADDSIYKSLESRYDYTLQALGVLAADRYLDNFFEDKIRSSSIVAQKLSMAPEVAAIRNRIQIIRRFREKHQHRFEKHLPWGHPTVSPKVWQLARLLNKYKASNLQAIIFAERRDDVKALAWLLPRLDTMEWVRCASIVGHGASDTASNGMTVKEQETVVKDFRQGSYNLLIASSVAEEGLDFQSLSLVVKFDVVQNVVSLAQSRGRARKAGSTYCAMIQIDRHDHIARFMDIMNSEARLMNWLSTKDDERDEPMDEEESQDVSEEERRARYVTSKGAVLTYSTSIPLLSELCALFPVDEYTGNLQPKYTGGFVVNLTLPSALPFPRDYLVFTGPECTTKAEAKRAVAFQAVKSLHKIGVFDDYLLPVREAALADGEDADGRTIPAGPAPKMMNVWSYTPFHDFWKAGAEVWIHPVNVGTGIVCGLVVGRALRIDVELDGMELGKVRLGSGSRLSFPDETSRMSSLRTIAMYNQEGTSWGITAKTSDLCSTAFLVPLLKKTRTPDWAEMERVLEPANPLWNRETHLQDGPLLGRSRRGHRAMLLKRVRDDMTIFSAPIKTSGPCKEMRYSSYAEFYRKYYDGTKHGPALEVADDDLMLEFVELRRARTAIRSTSSSSSAPGERILYFPHSVCCIVRLSLDMFYAFSALPALIRHITGYVRAQEAVRQLALPTLDRTRLVEALTLPLVCTGYDYQRLETLGDSCLKLATSVHVFNRFPNKHEGQLSILRRNSISNKFLRGHALEHSLFRYMNGERVVDGKDWLPPSTRLKYDEEGQPLTAQQLPRKAMQDCMEATLGVAWVTGGIDRVLETGTRLGLCFGGSVPWPQRYHRKERPVCETPPAFRGLMETLGYRFNDVWLLVEALTHPSCQSKETWSYNRVEFLGDALVDTFIMRYLFDKFTKASPGKLTLARMAAVNNVTLAAVAVKELSLDKCVLHASALLPQAAELARVEFDGMTYRDIVTSYWRLQPPKALGDLLEAVLGAIFIDCNYEVDVVFGIMDKVFDGVLRELHPDLPVDPTSDLMHYIAKRGCRKVRFNKSDTTESGLREYRVAVMIHDQEVAPPAGALHKLLSRQLSCDRVLKGLMAGEIDLKAICTCADDALDAQDERQVRKLLHRLDSDDEEHGKGEMDDRTEEMLSVEALMGANAREPALEMSEAVDEEEGQQVTESANTQDDGSMEMDME